MYFSLFQSSQITVPLWAWLLYGVILVSGTIVVGWLNRKRPSSVRAEDNKLEAEAISLNVQSLAELYEQIRSMRAETAMIVERHDATVRDLRALHAKQIEFLQSQIELKIESEHDAKALEKTLRDRAHDAANEIQRCTRRILEYEKVLSGSQTVFEPFDFTPYKEIMRDHKG